MTATKIIDWERVEAEYREGLISLRKIAEPFGITEAAIRKRAKRDGWDREIYSRKARAKPKVFINGADGTENKAGFVYVIYLDDTQNSRFYKIGMSSNLNGRIDSHQGSSPFDICVACAYYTGNMRAEERELHAIFNDNRIRGEC